MCRRTLYCFVLLTGEKRNNIKIIIDGSREEAVAADVVEAGDAVFNLTPTKREAPQDAPRRVFLTTNPAVPRHHHRLSNSDCIELPVRFHPNGDADIFLCPDQLRLLEAQQRVLRFGFYVPGYSYFTLSVRFHLAFYLRI